MKDKELISREEFAKMFDIAMICEIEKDGHKFRPYIAIKANGLMLRIIENYFSQELPTIYVQYSQFNRRVFIRAVKNTAPLLEHIIPYLKFKKDIAEELQKYIYHRISEKQKGWGQYSEVDLKHYNDMLKLNGKVKLVKN